MDGCIGDTVDGITCEHLPWFNGFNSNISKNQSSYTLCVSQTLPFFVCSCSIVTLKPLANPMAGEGKVIKQKQKMKKCIVGILYFNL